MANSSLTLWQIRGETLLRPKNGRVACSRILQNYESQTKPLQNWRSGSSAESRIYNFIGKCGGLPAAATNPQLKKLKRKIMKTNRTIAGWLMLLALSTLNLQPSTAFAQGTTAFTYQGQLRDGGTNASGAYTMIFKLYDAASAGNQVGSSITNGTTLGNGLFSVNLDFGASAFNGRARWLDITVSNGVAQTLSPRVQVLPAPYAQFAAIAATVTNGAIMNAQLAGNAVATTNIQNNAVTTAQIANGAIMNAQLAANSVNAANIASGQVVKTINGLSDFVTLKAGANVSVFTNGNTLQFSAGVPSIAPFWMTGINDIYFVVPTNVTRIMVEMWGAGGGGGDGLWSNPNGGINSPGGGGGGAGGYAMNVFNVTPGTSFKVIAQENGHHGGNGGYASFGNPSAPLMIAYGGSGGGAETIDVNTNLVYGNGGVGGTASGGFVNYPGGNGQNGQNGGIGGSVWRGGDGYNGGPGEGGRGGVILSGQPAVVIVYY